MVYNMYIVMQDSVRHLMDSLGPKTPQRNLRTNGIARSIGQVTPRSLAESWDNCTVPSPCLGVQISGAAASEPCTNPPQDRHLLGHQACPLRSSWQCLSAAFCEDVLDYQGCCTQGTISKKSQEDRSYFSEEFLR